MEDWNSIKQPLNFDNIKYITLVRKNLTILPNWISKCKNLIHLNCADNYIKEIPDWISNLNKLIVLKCNDNYITKISDYLPNSLERIYCNNNNLSELPLSIINLQKIIFINYKTNLIDINCHYNFRDDDDDSSNDDTINDDSSDDWVDWRYDYDPNIKYCMDLCKDGCNAEDCPCNAECEYHENNLDNHPLVDYFLTTIYNEYFEESSSDNDKDIKQYCYNIMWKVRMEF